MKSVYYFFISLFLFINISSCRNQTYPTMSRSWDSKIDGTVSWIIPDTPNGLKPSQCWFSIGSSPDGDIYIGACDHETNSALYRINTKDDILYYIGDARSASEKVNNWLEDETAEKFHVRPLYHKGKIYLATADFSYLTDAYLYKRGFHWYSYDISGNVFSDLSINDPGGISGEHASIMAIAIDQKREYIYGLDSPKALLFRYDINKGTTENLGRANFLTENYYTPGRYIWVDSDGKVYFTLSGFDNVLYYDPDKKIFAGHADWKLRNIYYSDKNLRAGQWSFDGKRCYLTDYEANFYLFNDIDKSFSFLGKAIGTADHYKNQMVFRVRVFNVSADEKKIYFANDDADKFSLIEFDIEKKQTKRLCYMSDIDDKFKGTKYFNKAGNDSWDNLGRFYIASFGNELVNTTNVIVTRIDPVLLKVKLGLNELIEVGMSEKNDKIIITRNGGLNKDIDVILGLKELDSSLINKTIKVKIPSQIGSIELIKSKIPEIKNINSNNYKIILIPDGNNYKVEHSIKN
ncbi:MAG: hypothetical protein JXB50_08485 [Spirochaetes bacterium]|nr:hypothetical protein [Spirochaetota bacterium]